MANTYLSVKQKVRSLLGDQYADWLTDQELQEPTNQVYEQQISYLAGTCSPFDSKVVTVPNVPVGATTLQPYQQTGQLLAGLYKPRRVEWKQPGTPNNYFIELMECDILPDVIAGNVPYGISGAWEWRSYVIYLTPASQAMDVRVRGDFQPPPLVKDTDILIVHPLMAHSTAYGVASLLAAQRGNSAWETSYGAQATSTLDEIAAQLVRQQQKLTFRVGSPNGRNQRQGFRS